MSDDQENFKTPTKTQQGAFDSLLLYFSPVT